MKGVDLGVFCQVPGGKGGDQPAQPRFGGGQVFAGGEQESGLLPPQGGVACIEDGDQGSGVFACVGSGDPAPVAAPLDDLCGEIGLGVEERRRVGTDHGLQGFGGGFAVQPVGQGGERAEIL